MSTKEGGVKNPPNPVNVVYEWPKQVQLMVHTCLKISRIIYLGVSAVGGFPIEIETQISKLITYRLAIFIL